MPYVFPGWYGSYPLSESVQEKVNWLLSAGMLKAPKGDGDVIAIVAPITTAINNRNKTIADVFLSIVSPIY